MIPPFQLPSNPAVKIFLTEATVAQCLDFSESDPECEEQVTTLWINRIQDPAKFVDCQTWTADDRRLALLWYFLHTEEDTTTPLSYPCRCGKEHTTLLDMRQVAENYQTMEGKGKPERVVEFQREKYTVRPLSGAQMEELEGKRMGLSELSEKEKQKALARIRLEALAMRVEDDVHPRQEVVRRFLSMSKSEFTDLSSLIHSAADEMEHGLLSEISDGKIYLIAAMICPDRKEVMTPLRVPFRCYYNAPGAGIY